MHTAPSHRQTKGLLPTHMLLLWLGLLQVCLWLWDASPCGATGLMLPDASEIPGWHMAGSPYRYGSEDLYEYINGEADFFLAYGFVVLVGAVYEAASDPEQFITVDLYDMGEKLGAFGVYQAKGDASLTPLGMGAASAGTEGYASFYKGRFYVEVLSVTREEKWKQHHIRLARSVADKIKGDSSPPPELAWFPEEGKIRGSERYVVGGILAHSFLHKGLICRYEEEGEGVWAYMAFFETADDADRAHEQHRAFLQGSGQPCLPVTVRGADGFFAKEPFHKQIVEVRKGSFVIGVYDLRDGDTGKRLIGKMLERIPSFRRGKSPPAD